MKISREEKVIGGRLSYRDASIACRGIPVAGYAACDNLVEGLWGTCSKAGIETGRELTHSFRFQV